MLQGQNFALTAKAAIKEETTMKSLLGKLCLSIVLAVTSHVSIAQDLKFFRIGSGAAGGAYFPIAGSIANAISNPPGSRPCDKGGSCGVPGLVAVAQASNASVANVNSVQSGQIESGLAAAFVVHAAFNGEGDFAKTGRLDKLRVIANLFPEEFHLVTAKGLKLKSLADLKGKRVGIGQAGSGTQVAVLRMLKEYGVDRSNMDASELNQSQSVERIADGKMDAVFYIAPAPTAAFIQLDSTKGMELYSFSDAERAKVRSLFPFFYEEIIPAGTYVNVKTDVKTIAVGAQWVTSSAVPEQLVYDITKALWNDSSAELFQSSHPKAKMIKVKGALSAVNTPLHPGAERYYKEIGLLKK